MRVLMIAPEPFFEPRGTPFSILNRVVSLARQSIQVDLVTYPIGEDPKLPGVTLHRARRIPGIRHVPIGFSLRKLVLDFFLLIKACRLLARNRYDLIHTHEEAALLGHWLAKRYDVPHLYDMHSNLLEQMRASLLFRHGPLRWLGDRLQRAAVCNADAVITICPELESYVKQVAPDVPTVLIENMFDAFAEETVSCDREAARRRLGLGEQPVLLYTGTFEAYQGLDLVVQAAPRVLALHPEARFVLVGGTPVQVRKVQAAVVQVGVGEQVLFTGTVPAREIRSFIEMADVLLSPRRHGSNTPSKIYTYLRSGRPIVATNLQTHTQVLTPEIAVLTDSTPAGFAAGICELLDSPERRRTLGERARAFAAAKFDTAIYHGNLSRIYHAAVHGNASPAGTAT
ncbi:MAG: glycosyltransferase [Planctomycetes bacterium]|nr:glycosyltransferase [Planctomycetota bacterium]